MIDLIVLIVQLIHFSIFKEKERERARNGKMTKQLMNDANSSCIKHKTDAHIDYI